MKILKKYLSCHQPDGTLYPPCTRGAWDTSVVGVAAVPPEGRLSCKKVAFGKLKKVGSRLPTSHKLGKKLTPLISG